MLGFKRFISRGKTNFINNDVNQYQAPSQRLELVHVRTSMHPKQLSGLRRFFRICRGGLQALASKDK
jgi:hypothetical protein